MFVFSNIYSFKQYFLRCTESYIQLNNGEKICGNRKSGIIAQKCGTNFKLNYYVGSKSYKGFKVYYECKFTLLYFIFFD